MNCSLISSLVTLSELFRTATAILFPNMFLRCIHIPNFSFDISTILGSSFPSSFFILTISRVISGSLISLYLFKKELIEKNKITFDEDLRIFEDLLFCYKLFLLANKISYVDEALYNYNCTNEHSLTNKFTNKMFDVFIALDRLKEFAESKYSYDLEKQLEYISIKHISLRFTSKTADKKSLLEYVDKSFEYLRVNYPNYKKSVYYKGIKGFIKKNKLLVKLLVIKNNL